MIEELLDPALRRFRVSTIGRRVLKFYCFWANRRQTCCEKLGYGQLDVRHQEVPVELCIFRDRYVVRGEADSLHASDLEDHSGQIGVFAKMLVTELHHLSSLPENFPI